MQWANMRLVRIAGHTPAACQWVDGGNARKGSPMNGHPTLPTGTVTFHFPDIEGSTRLRGLDRPMVY
jgi:hypothetical protein